MPKPTAERVDGCVFFLQQRNEQQQQYDNDKNKENDNGNSKDNTRTKNNTTKMTNKYNDGNKMNNNNNNFSPAQPSGSLLGMFITLASIKEWN